MNFIKDSLLNNREIKLLVLFIVFDVIFGILRAIKERKVNSTIGIDGIIRKCGMMFSILLCVIIDKIINIDLVSFLPVEIKEYLGINKCGVSFLFNSLYIVFEILSIMKNMVKCKLPLPKKLKNLFEKILKEFTNEME